MVVSSVVVVVVSMTMVVVMMMVVSVSYTHLEMSSSLFKLQQKSCFFHPVASLLGRHFLLTLSQHLSLSQVASPPRVSCVCIIFRSFFFRPGAILTWSLHYTCSRLEGARFRHTTDSPLTSLFLLLLLESSQHLSVYSIRTRKIPLTLRPLSFLSLSLSLCGATHDSKYQAPPLTKKNLSSSICAQLEVGRRRGWIMLTHSSLLLHVYTKAWLSQRIRETLDWNYSLQFASVFGTLMILFFFFSLSLYFLRPSRSEKGTLHVMLLPRGRCSIHGLTDDLFLRTHLSVRTSVRSFVVGAFWDQPVGPVCVRRLLLLLSARSRLLQCVSVVHRWRPSNGQWFWCKLGCCCCCCVVAIVLLCSCWKTDRSVVAV